MLSENQSEACARCKAEYRKPLEDKIKRLQTENQNLKATAQIAVTAGESLKKELEALKAQIKRTLEYARRSGGPPYWKIKELLKEGK